MGSLSDVFNFEKFQLEKFFKEIGSHPQRLLTGIDPLSTEFWNMVTGSDFDPLVNQLGGATDATMQEARIEGIDTGLANTLHDTAGIIASFYGGAGLSGGLESAGLSPALAGLTSDVAFSTDPQDPLGGSANEGNAAAANVGRGGFDFGSLLSGLGGGGGQQGETPEQKAARMLKEQQEKERQRKAKEAQEELKKILQQISEDAVGSASGLPSAQGLPSAFGGLR